VTDATVRWDAQRLIRDLGGATHVRTNMLKHGLEVPALPTIRNWLYRDRVPGHAVALLLVLGKRMSSRFNPYDYVLIEDENGERPCTG